MAANQSAWLSAQGLDPAAMSDALSARFLDDLVHETLTKNPREAHKTMTRVWNRCARTIPGWPPVALTEPRYRVIWGFPETAFPASLWAEVDAFFVRRRRESSGDIFDESRASARLSRRTIATRRDHVRCIASALVRPGHPIERLASLAYLVDPPHLEAALRFYIERYADKPSRYITQLAFTMLDIARHAVRPADWERCRRRPYDKAAHDDEIARVKFFYERIQRRANEHHTPKDEELVAPFDDEVAKRRFLAFPFDAFANLLETDRGGVLDALRAQVLAVLAMWVFAPMRISELLGLRLEDLRWVEGPNGATVLRIRAYQSKTRKFRHDEIPGEIAEPLRVYIERFRPRLVDGINPWLIPGETPDAPKLPASFREPLEKAVWKGTGVRFHPHLIRKIAAKLFLDERPGEQAVIQRVLDHESERTTRRFYISAQSRASQRVYHQVLLDLLHRPDAGPGTSRRRRRAKMED